jgi:hypothetical protein
MKQEDFFVRKVLSIMNIFQRKYKGLHYTIKLDSFEDAIPVTIYNKDFKNGLTFAIPREDRDYIFRMFFDNTKRFIIAETSGSWQKTAKIMEDDMSKLIRRCAL